MGTISVRGIGKAYRQYHSRWSRLAEWLLPFAGPRHELKWVLRDISFDVEPGRAMGIIGVNGAGKSTLLKIITGTTLPSEGQVQIGGRVAALLELGMGFHPDFTGRQNALMAGQLLGLQAGEVEALMPQIEAFSEIGPYFDMPVRVYSSGMQVRLAFSVATAVRPDVLIVDEALSVGDTYFQHKSFDRIRSFREQGTTLLLVSHDKAAIQAICDEAILLNGGRLELRGEPEAVMDYYNALIAEKESRTVRQLRTEDGRTQTVSGTSEATFGRLRLLAQDGQEAKTIAAGSRLTLELQVQVHRPLPGLVVGFMIKDRLGQPVFGTNTYHLGQAQGPVDGPAWFEVRFEFPAHLGPGSYSVAAAIHDSETHLTRNFEWRDLALVFQVVNEDLPPFVGTAYLPTAATVRPVEPVVADELT